MDDELSMAGNADRSLSELSLHVAVNSVVFAPGNTRNRDVTTTRCHSSSGGDDDATTSSGYEAGTCWSRDDDVIVDDDDVRVSWSDSTDSRQPPVAYRYQVLSLTLRYTCITSFKS